MFLSSFVIFFCLRMYRMLRCGSWIPCWWIVFRSIGCFTPPCNWSKLVCIFHLKHSWQFIHFYFMFEIIITLIIYKSVIIIETYLCRSIQLNIVITLWFTSTNRLPLHVFIHFHYSINLYQLHKVPMCIFTSVGVYYCCAVLFFEASLIIDSIRMEVVIRL